MSQFMKEHRQYFESEAGLELTKSLQNEISSMHQKAESATDSDLAYAFTQRAKGIREALNVIKSMTTGGKKPA